MNFTQTVSKILASRIMRSRFQYQLINRVNAEMNTEFFSAIMGGQILFLTGQQHFLITIP